MLQRIKKYSERDSNWIIEITLKGSIRHDKRYTKNIFMSLAESEWYFTYELVSILLSANRFAECWKTFRYFLGKDHGKVSIRERGTETSFRRYLFSRIFANSAIPLSVPTVCRVHFLQLPRLSRFFSASTFLTARPLVYLYVAGRETTWEIRLWMTGDTFFTLITSRLNSVFGGNTPLKPGVFDSLPFGTFPFVAPNVQRISTTV